MKTFLITVLVFTLFLLIGFPSLILFLYFKNDYVGTETDIRRSVYLSNKPEVWQEPLTVKIVTFNIQDLMLVGRNRVARMKHIARVLTALDPDIVGFQESFIDKDREILINALKGSRLQYHQYYPSGLVGSGLLISSAWPVREVLFHRYKASNPAKRVWEGDYWGGKGVALARIETPAGLLDFYCTHAQAGYGRAEYRDVRRMQMAELSIFMNESRTGTAPTFLVGDMNCGIGAVDFETATKGAGLFRTMKEDSGIDHIFAAHNIRYEFETLDTVRIEERINEGDRSFSLSDHPGFMSTVRIVPVTSNT